MPSLKSIKLRIKSVKSTQKITSAMKMVAASKLKRAREQADVAHVYASKMATMLKNIASGVGASAQDMPILYGTGEDNTHLFIVITSDRGLCGSFNQNVCKLARKRIAELEEEGKVVKLVCIGKKGYDLLKGQHAEKIIKFYPHLIGNSGVGFASAKQVADFVIDSLEHGAFDKCVIIYNQFKSVMVQAPIEQQIIPLPLADAEDAVSTAECEPDEAQILEQLLPKNLAMQCFTYLLASSASEQAARMTAMENATRNSGEMIKKLNLVYNRTRQAYITKELIEIISGAEAA